MTEISQAETSMTVSRTKQQNKNQFESDFMEFARLINVWEDVKFGEVKPMEVFSATYISHCCIKPKPGKKLKKTSYALWLAWSG